MASKERFGKYEVVQRLGHGGMAEVYEATDPLLGRTVAIKTILPHLASEPGFGQRFLNEARLISTLRHPHIVQLFDYDVIDDQPFMVMEYLAGDTLKQRMSELRDRGEWFSFEESVALLEPVAAALDYAHEQGAIHRDIKPANILFTDAGEPVVADFGIARLLSQSTRLSAAGAVIGTPAYMSPEQVAGDLVDGRSDQYSLATILYELITGRLPFLGDSPSAMLLAHLKEPPPPARQFNPNLPKAAEAVLLRALAKRPAERFETSGPMLEGFAAALRGERAIEIRTGPSGDDIQTIVDDSLGSDEEKQRLEGEELGSDRDGSHRLPVIVQGAAAARAEGKVAADHNLPEQTTQFVGRETELAELSELLVDTNCRLITLVGAGGVGKTRLAIAAAEAQVNRFQNGVVFVPLVGVSAKDDDEAVALLIDQIANAIDFNFSAQLPPQDLLFNHLASKEMLLLLDNFEQLRGAAPFLVDLVSRTVDVKLLVTSRERLGIQPEWLYEVHGLRYPSDTTGNDLLKYAAVELFAQRARQLQPDFSPVVETACITRICRVVEGSPLGLELAANWTRSLACEEIVRKIESDLDTLAATSPIVDERHLSIRVVLDHSWNLLNEDEQQLFRLLSVFRGGFTLHAAEQVVEASISVLGALIDKSLLRRSANGRYNIHELVRQYGEARLAKDPEEHALVEQRHRQYYAGFLEERKPKRGEFVNPETIAELDVEVDNLRLAWKSLIRTESIDAIDAFLEVLWLYYQRKGWFENALSALEQAYAIEGGTALRNASLAWKIGEAYRGLGRPQESRSFFLQALETLGQPMPTTKLGFTVGLFRQIFRQVLHRLWPSKFVGGAPEAKRAALRESVLAYERLAYLLYVEGASLPLFYATVRLLNLAERAGPSPELARAYATTGFSAGLIPLHSLAESYGRLALEHTEVTEDPFALATVLELSGIYNAGIGRWARAVEDLTQARDTFQRIGRMRSWEECHATIALVCYWRGQYSRSESLGRDLYVSAEKRSDPQAQVWGLVIQAMACLRLGGSRDLDRAQPLMLQAQGLLAGYQFSARPDQIFESGLLAQVYMRKGEVEPAYSAAETALRHINAELVPVTYYGFEGYAGGPAVFLRLWEAAKREAGSSQNQGSLRKLARQSCKDLQGYARVFPIGRSRALLYRGLYNWLDDKPRKAHNSWQKALTHGEDVEMPYEQGLAHYEIGRHLESDDPDREKHLKRAIDIFSRLGAAWDLAQTKEALGA